jgi:uncharacterized membrane protein
MHTDSGQRSLISAGALLGMGLGGFLDGIVFHQLLQLHNMLSARVDRSTIIGLEVNMFWDGVFHLFTWLMTLLGVAALWRTARRGDVPLCTRTFVGALLLGWGLFNLVEGVINHHILHIHHVTETEGHLFWDLMILASGLLFIGAGLWLVQGNRKQEPAYRGHVAALREGA